MWQFQRNLTCRDERTSYGVTKGQRQWSGPTPPWHALVLKIFHFMWNLRPYHETLHLRPYCLKKNVTRNYRGSLHSWWLLANKSNQEKQANINSHQKTRGCECLLAKRDSGNPKQGIWETEINFVKLLRFLTSTLWRKFKQKCLSTMCPGFSHWGSKHFQRILYNISQSHISHRLIDIYFPILYSLGR